MRVAVIGGGASGLVTTWLLDEAHDVTLFELSPMLGGNIRTLGRNLPRHPDVPEGVFLDGGVVEFGKENFPTFHRLMDRLDVPMRRVPGTTSLVRADGFQLVSPACVAELPLSQRLGQWARLLGLAGARRRFFARTDAELDGTALSDHLDDDTWGLWLRLLTTYAYSIPFDEVGGVAGLLAIPMLRAFCQANTWTAVEGGTYSYVERLLGGLSGTVHTGARVDRITRPDGKVQLTMATGEHLDFDAVVFATPPDQVLALLGDPSDGERRRFGAWQANHVHTLIHRDASPYTSRGLLVATEFDVFELDGGRGGYNARLDRLAGRPAGHPPAWSLAYGLDDELDPDAVIAKVDHHTPRFTVDALSTRHEVRATNGNNHTWIAGAWLGDGLHEGAVCSALAVSEGLGGRTI